jgi:hypothetical protein
VPKPILIALPEITSRLSAVGDREKARAGRSRELNPLDIFLWGYIKMVHASAMDTAEELLKRVQNGWSSSLLAFISSSVNRFIVGKNAEWQCKANILGIYCNFNNCHLLLLEYKSIFYKTVALFHVQNWPYIKVTNNT